MRKRHKFVALTIRFLLLVALLGAAGFVALICDYGARQEYTEHRLNNIATAYLSSVGKDGPDAAGLIAHIAATPKEFYTRIFGDMPELERAMRERRIADQRT
jgi:hypothetical protein